MTEDKKMIALDEDMEDLWDKETQKRDSMASAIREWQNDGFGIFMHFSPSTAFQGRYRGKELDKDLWAEWMMFRAEIPIQEYEEQLRSWNPDRFDAAEWAACKGRGWQWSEYEF
jgi:hypothetical protein